MTWLAIVVMSLGLPIGMLIERVRERRAAYRQRAAELRQGIENARHWREVQDGINAELREAELAAQAEARRDRLVSARACGCEACQVFMAQNQPAVRN